MRRVGGVRRALIGKANPWMLQHDSELRDDWIELQRLWEQLEELSGDVDLAIDRLAPRQG